ncbi:MAG: histidine phosphatase family protein, partial [Chloroflexi bacterium]|nr:histidine phosphatase family protein [Chloroflexota bacterium]
GRAQVKALVALSLWANVTAIYTSRQFKAAVVGEAVLAAHGIPLRLIDDLDEARRESWLGPEAFEAAQQAFFVDPTNAPVSGWESAQAAQARFGAAIDRLLRSHPLSESVAVVAHATVLTLYTAHLRGDLPTMADWRKIGFAAIMEVDRATLHPITPFLSAPYPAGL